MGISVLSTERVGEVGMIEQVEELHAELGGETLTKFPILRDREIYVAKTGIAENVAAHRAEGSERRGNQDGLAVRIATERIESVGRADGSGLIYARVGQWMDRVALFEELDSRAR